MASLPSTAGSALAQVSTSSGPHVSITNPTNGESIFAGKINVTGHASPSAGATVDSVNIRIDSGNYVRATNLAGGWSSWVMMGVNIQTTGQHKVVAKVMDSLGMTAYAAVNVTVLAIPVVPTSTIDTAIPSLAITSPTAGATVNTSTITVRGTAQDIGSGIKAIEVQLNGSSYKLATQDSAGSWSTWHAT